jgi:hypothetical protein
MIMGAVWLLAGEAAWCIAAESGGAPGNPSADAFKQRRKEAAHRQRRIIFNNDGDDLVYECKAVTAEELLKARTTALAGSQVDSIFYCTWSSGFGVFTHNTKVGQVFESCEAPFTNNPTRAFLDAGMDPLRVMTEFGRKHGIEVFWSLRMNDTHDGSLTAYGPVMFNMNKLKVAHPEYLFGSPQQRPQYGAWSAVDFGRAEVRDLAFRYVEEVCRNYDVDGVELDFFRHPIFFKHNAQGLPCDDEDRAQMTGLLRRIRAMADNVGRQRGRPLLMAVRVPDSVEYSRAIGIDLERWLADDLADLLVVTSYIQLNPWDYSVALGHKYGVPVYPSLDESRVRDESARALRSSVAAYRARAMNVWAAGADGVYMFNFFNPRSPLWRELGDPATLQRMDKDYFASVRGVGVAAGNSLPHQSFIHVATLNPGAPLPLAPEKPASVKFSVGDDVRWGETKGVRANLTLRLQFKALKQPANAIVTLNDTPLTGGTMAKNWLEFKLDAKVAQQGTNIVTVTPAAQDRGSLTDLQLTVRYKGARQKP